VLPRLQALYPSLFAAERRAADYLIANPREALNVTIDQAAGAAGVSTAIFVRLAKRLGYSGYRDLKLKLASDTGREQATQGPLSLIHEEVLPSDSAFEVARKVVHADVRALMDALETLDAAAFDEAVGLLVTAPYCVFYGIGSSAPIAVDAHYRFLQLGRRVSVVTDSHMQAVSASTLRPGDLAFMVSHTGRTKEILACAQQAREAGAEIVALSSHADTPLSRLADVTLVTSTRETAFRVEAMASRIAHLSVVDALYVAAALRLEGAVERIRKSLSVIAEKRI
jgi:RpiR family transcriptional regulator, carbohydrate utilization regulator